MPELLWTIMKVGFTALLISIAVIDWRRHIVPLKFSLPLLLGGYLAAALQGAWGALLAGAVILFLSEEWARVHIPNHMRLGLGLATGAAGLLLSTGSPVSILITLAWVGVWLFWEANILGGGDALVFMGLVGLFPDIRFIGLTLAVVIVVGTLLLLRRFNSAAVYLIPLAMKNMATLGKAGALPTRQERDARGRPTAFLLSLAGGLYLWLFGVVGL